ncbi:hypothetical protein J4402_03440 [Candidatus Pacearchaeota archaeon]|nr:hypothetical protein [Candidatus Pacearchaeota archaeon]
MDYLQIFRVIVVLVIFVFSALPLHRAVRIFKPKTTYWKTFLVVLISGFFVSLINSFFTFWGGFVAFVFLIFVYSKAFGLKKRKAFLVWVLQLVFVVVSSLIFELAVRLISDFSFFGG